MAPTIRFFYYMHLRVYAKASAESPVSVHRFQNYFVNESKTFNMPLANSTNDGMQAYSFAPFNVVGTAASLGGDNTTLQVLLPMNEIAIKFVELGNGNRFSRLALAGVFVNGADSEQVQGYDYYIGQGAAFSEDTIELRFRGANDSVGNGFPSRKITRSLVGVLPLNADVRLQ